MPNISEVIFYFANPQQTLEGSVILDAPPESVTLTWQQVVDNVGFSLSTGESMFTEIPSNSDTYSIRIINGFYFGTGKYGSLLGVQYKYEDGTDGWIKEVKYASATSLNLDSIVGNWIKGLTYGQITSHPNWKGKPFIGLESDYIDILVERILPDMTLNLEPMSKTILEGEDIEFSYSAVDYVEGNPTFTWEFNTALITPLAETEGTKTLSFNQAGSYTVKLTATNIINQVASKTATIIVQERPVVPCELSLTPNTVNIRLGDTVQFDALHPYPETGIWTFDPSLTVVQKDNKVLKVKPKVTGEYSIAYKVNACEERAILYVLPKTVEEEFIDPIEPEPPALPNTPPETGGSPSLVMDLLDASVPIPPLHKYPNIMKRNSRYRGQRESEKVLNDHQEQIFDIRQLHKDIDSIAKMIDGSIDSWFNGIETSSITTKDPAIKTYSKNDLSNQQQTDVDSVRVFESDVIQLSGNVFEERMVGIYGIKRRMQELDERIAEAERRFRDYENAYE